MDDIDSRILDQLQRYGRIDNNVLASRVALSPSACLRRVRRLESAGTIKGYAAILNEQALGLGLVVLVDVVMNQTTKSSLDEFEQRVCEIPQVVSCFRTLGETDYVLKIVARDLREYDALYLKDLINLPNVMRANSTVVMAVVKETTERPLPVG
jgi:Lrp/AsnC family transcriptional regulator, leucine-responsive regulatory protein